MKTLVLLFSLLGTLNAYAQYPYSYNNDYNTTTVPTYTGKNLDSLVNVVLNGRNPNNQSVTPAPTNSIAPTNNVVAPMQQPNGDLPVRSALPATPGAFNSEGPLPNLYRNQGPLPNLNNNQGTPPSTFTTPPAQSIPVPGLGLDSPSGF